MPDEEQVRRDFRRILDQRSDLGTAKIICNWFFEPANIFDPNATKKLKPEVIFALSYLALMAAACAAFNFM
jgi:hypothetical protein